MTAIDRYSLSKWKSVGGILPSVEYHFRVKAALYLQAESRWVLQTWMAWWLESYSRYWKTPMKSNYSNQRPSQRWWLSLQNVAFLESSHCHPNILRTIASIALLHETLILIDSRVLIATFYFNDAAWGRPVLKKAANAISMNLQHHSFNRIW